MEFINKMANRSFTEVLDFIIEFREHIIKKQDNGLNIGLINKLDITLNGKYRSYKETVFNKNIIKLGNDFKLEEYKEFIEILSE